MEEEVFAGAGAAACLDCLFAKTGGAGAGAGCVANFGPPSGRRPPAEKGRAGAAAAAKGDQPTEEVSGDATSSVSSDEPPSTNGGAEVADDTA